MRMVAGLTYVAAVLCVLLGAAAVHAVATTTAAGTDGGADVAALQREVGQCVSSVQTLRRQSIRYARTRFRIV